MTDSSERMKDLRELRALKEAYLNVRAPGTMAARIRAATEAASPARWRYWVPITAGALAAVGIAAMLLLTVRQETVSEHGIRARPIPLSMIRGRVPTRPAFGMPTLRDVGPVPLMPSMHVLRPDDYRDAEEPQTGIHNPARAEPAPG